MNNKNITIAVFAVLALVLGAIVVLPQDALGYKGDSNTRGPNCTADQRAEMNRSRENRGNNGQKECDGSGKSQRKTGDRQGCRYQ